ncbi:MAG: diguanylate cyclase [Alphaproteobacteria bacterium]|nr:diguanylate cyclase [Alphaproteobacteria bacterium]
MTGKSTADFKGGLGRWFRATHEEALETGRPIYTVHSAQLAASVISWERLILPVTGPDGTPWIVCYNESLNSKSDLFDGIMTASQDGIILFRPSFDDAGILVDFEFLAVNQKAINILGRSESELIGHRLKDVFPAAQGVETYKEVWDTGTPGEFEANHLEISRVFHVAVGKAAGKLIVTFSDITDMREAQECLEQQSAELMFINETLQEQASVLVGLAEDKSLAEREAREAQRFTSQLFEAIPLPMYYRLKDGTLGLVNSSYADLFNADREQISGRPLADLLPPEIVAWIDEKDAELFADPQQKQTYERDAHFPAATDRRMVVNKAAIFGDDGTPNGVIVAMMDTTEQYHLSQELTRLASTDSLTGLYNRRMFQERSEEVFGRVCRYGHHASLIILDIDRFKAINDGFGHDIGDNLLIRLAEILNASLRRSGDLAARLGGEEFVLLLPDTNPEGAMALAEHLRAIFEETTIATPSGPQRFTASFGVAAMSSADQSVQDTLKRADAALYHAKNNGRNQVRRAAA